MKKILITGGNGYLARNILPSLSDFEVTVLTHADLDLTNIWVMYEWFRDKYFDVVLHTAIQGGSRLQPDKVTDAWHNMKMFTNLLKNKSHFGRLINFGSGAEYADSAYGISKRCIHQYVRTTDNLYTIRIFAVFNHDELDTRFIKSNLLRYLAQEPMIVHQNKFMDFFYMEDLIKLVRFYITEPEPPKETDCSYADRITLYRVASYINELPNYKVGITVENPGFAREYTGTYTDLGIEYIGLKEGIRKTYNILTQ